MAPVRRYLRITKFSVLECRIYLDNPSLANSWLLNPRDPVLPRVVECIRPLVLPKLREEKERARKKSNKKKGIKDVIETDEFEVSMFLTETPTRHSILMKHKHFRDKLPPRMQSNSSKLLGETSASPIDVDYVAAPILREEDEEDISLDNIPEAGDVGQGKRPRASPESGSEFGGDSDVESVHGSAPPSKRARQVEEPSEAEEDEDDDDDKKKMAMDISYEGFAIYGRILCLVVKRREPAGGRAPAAAAAAAAAADAGEKPTGQAVMENWISSTQVPVGMEDETEAR